MYNCGRKPRTSLLQYFDCHCVPLRADSNRGSGWAKLKINTLTEFLTMNPWQEVTKNSFDRSKDKFARIESQVVPACIVARLAFSRTERMLNKQSQRTDRLVGEINNCAKDPPFLSSPIGERTLCALGLCLGGARKTRTKRSLLPDRWIRPRRKRSSVSLWSRRMAGCVSRFMYTRIN